MKVALYARCSTKKQDLTSQRSALETWAKKNGYDFTTYEDFAVSGKKDSRKGINQLMQDARAGAFQKVGVVELSRIGRSMKFIHSVIEELSQRGINIILTNSNTEIDPNTLEGTALIGALGTAAAIEWKLIQERNERARQAIKEKNVKVGRKKSPVSTQAILALREQGYSVRQIAEELNSSVGTIHRRLSSEIGQLRNVPNSQGKGDAVNKETGSVPKSGGCSE